MLYAARYMTDKMLKFVKLEQQNPPKREVLDRKEDFNEMYREFINEKAKEQSSRCSQCGVPFCQVHCPLSNNIPCLLYTSPSPRDGLLSRMPSSA